MESFFDELPEALGSKAFRNYCDTLYGHGLRLDDALIEEDVELLAAFAECARGGRILDAGCGSGDLLRYLCAQVDADGVGIDPSPACLHGPADAEGRTGSLYQKAVAAAGERRSLLSRANALEGMEAIRTADAQAATELRREGRLTFVSTGAAACESVTGRFDLILAIDSLDACQDPAAAIGKLVGFLAPGGFLLIAHTERRSPSDPALAFSSTLAARALKGRGLDIRGRELTRSEKLHWKLSRRLLGALEADCAAEGSPRIHERLAAAIEAMSASVDNEDFRRYWYRVRLAPGKG